MKWPQLVERRWFFSPRLESFKIKLIERMRKELPKDRLWILSSGTQSLDTVKAIGLTEAALLTAAEGANTHLESTGRDRWLVAIPDFHVGGISIYARAHLSGAKVVEFGGKWSPKAFCTSVDKNKITLTSLVPTQVYDLCREGLLAPSSLRAIVVGGGALDSALYSRARELGWPVLPSYGLTECGSQVMTAALESLKHSDYPPLLALPHVAIELREGRVAIRSKALTHSVAVARARKIEVVDPAEDGWYLTEDLAEKVSGGYRILGRQDDVVKVLGVLVPVSAIESELRARMETNSVAVVALADARAGSRLVLVVEGETSVEKAQLLIAHYNAEKPGTHRVSTVMWVPQIPRSDLGKVKKAELSRLLN